MNELLKIRELLKDEEPDMSESQYYRGVRAGVLPVIQTGPSNGYRLTVDLWRRFKRGEHIDARYFLKKGAA
jgi:hypothetical protein